LKVPLPPSFLSFFTRLGALLIPISPGARCGAFLGVLFYCISPALFAEGFAEGASLRARSRYLSNNGIIVDPGEIDIDSYLSSYDFGYPEPQTPIGVNIFNSVNRPDPRKAVPGGTEGFLQIGVQAKSQDFGELPPLNLVLVIDTSIAMNDDNKLSWFKASMRKFIQKIRNTDALSLVSFSNTAQVVFQPTLMDTPQKRRAFLTVVDNLYPQGTPNIEAGITLGYEQAIPYFRSNSINQVLLFSAGDANTTRLLMPNLNTGDIRVSLTWNNRNDLDLHVVGPTGEEINFNNPRDSHGGYLDLDRNLYGETTKPMETIFWPNNMAPPGKYRVFVKNYVSNEPDPFPTPFQIEIKNGNEYLYFNGSVRGAGRVSLTEICTFEYTANDVFARLYQLASFRKQQGISLSTLGLGSKFDVELLQTLAEHSQGATRSLRNQAMVADVLNTEREFERIVAIPVRTLNIELNFTPGIQILEVLGGLGRIENTRITCTIDNLHQGDYRTLFIRYRIPPQNRGLQLTTLQITNQGSPGGASDAFKRDIVLTDPINDYAAGMLRHSGAVVDFAKALKEIGGHYSKAEHDVTRMELALRLSQETKLSLESAKRNLQKAVLNQELSVITKYVEILTGRVAENRRPVPPPVKGPRRMNEIRPVSEPRLVSETSPVGVTPPVSETRPMSETRLVSETRPLSKTRLVSETRPASETRLVSETRPLNETRPVSETRLVSETRPLNGTPPVSETRPVSEPRLVSETRPVTETQPVSETSPVTETRPASEPRLVRETRPVTETPPVQGTQPE
jgi:Ca-activated chloride channel family protein